MEELSLLKPNSENNNQKVSPGDGGVKRRLSFSSGVGVGAAGDANTTCSLLSLQSVLDDSSLLEHPEETDEQRTPNSVCPEERHPAGKEDFPHEQDRLSHADDATQNSVPNMGDAQQMSSEERDAELLRRAREEGCVNVLFPGAVTQDACFRFVSEILKCILYQRQQLPMTYEQLVLSQKGLTSSQGKDAVSRRPKQSAGLDGRKCQQTLQDLEELLQQLEVLFSLSRVPRVLLLMGGSLVLPKELYELNMEALVLAGGDHSLPASSCLRRLFRALFVADLLSDTRPVRLMSTTVMALAHRDCGVGWFRPKLQFKVPTRVKKQIISLSTEPRACKEPDADWLDFVWFQAPVAIKGFN